MVRLVHAARVQVASRSEERAQPCAPIHRRGLRHAMRQRLRQCRCLLLGEKTTRNGAGLDVLSHTKKGKFWRDLVGLFPAVIDYLCNPQIDAVKPPTLLLQTVSVSSRHPWLRTCFRFALQSHLLIGLEEYGLARSTQSSSCRHACRRADTVLCRFFQTYITSIDDRRGQEVDAAAVSTTWFSAIRPEYRGAVRNLPCSLDGWPASSTVNLG
jgi:hypothetical protein